MGKTSALYAIILSVQAYLNGNIMISRVPIQYGTMFHSVKQSNYLDYKINPLRALADEISGSCDKNL
jgi:hypothetical protein